MFHKMLLSVLLGRQLSLLLYHILCHWWGSLHQGVSPLSGFVIDKEFFYPVQFHSGRMVKKSHLGKDYFFRIGGFAM